MTCEEIVNDQEISQKFNDTNFGDSTPRNVLKYSLLKIASGFASGSTAKWIMVSMRLVKSDGVKMKLTKKGKQYLWAAFSENYKNE